MASARPTRQSARTALDRLDREPMRELRDLAALLVLERGEVLPCRAELVRRCRPAGGDARMRNADQLVEHLPRFGWFRVQAQGMSSPSSRITCSQKRAKLVAVPGAAGGGRALRVRSRLDPRAGAEPDLPPPAGAAGRGAGPLPARGEDGALLADRAREGAARSRRRSRSGGDRPWLSRSRRGDERLCVVGCEGRLKLIEEGNLRCLQPSACLVEIEPFDAVDLGECLDGA